MKRSRDDAAGSLEELGFTPLEARIYVELLRGGPLTGYRIAQRSGKAAANTYKALDVLAKRGVVACEDGQSRLYRALPFAEVASRLADDLARRAERAAAALRSLEAEPEDDRIYRLTDADAIFARARAMLAQAKESVVADAFPEAVGALSADLEAAAKRGATVAIQAYEPVSLSGVLVARHARETLATRSWPGVWLNLCVDGQATLIAHVYDDERTIGLWTQNPYVSWIFYSGIASETALTRLRELAVADPSVSLAAALEHVAPFLIADLPGRAALRRQLDSRKASS